MAYYHTNMDPSKMPKKLWEHPDPKSTAMWQFMQRINDKHNAGLKVNYCSFPFIHSNFPP